MHVEEAAGAAWRQLLLRCCVLCRVTLRSCRQKALGGAAACPCHGMLHGAVNAVLLGCCVLRGLPLSCRQGALGGAAACARYQVHGGATAVLLHCCAAVRVAIFAGKAHWQVLLRARAIECQCFVIAAAQAGKHNEKRESYGHALIIDPWGEVIGRLEDPQGTGERHTVSGWLL